MDKTKDLDTLALIALAHVRCGVREKLNGDARIDIPPITIETTKRAIAHTKELAETRNELVEAAEHFVNVERTMDRCVGDHFTRLLLAYQKYAQAKGPWF